MSPDGAGAWPSDPDERLARLVHDLRTPLTIVQGFAELLDRSATKLDDAAKELRDLVDAADDASRP